MSDETTNTENTNAQPTLDAAEDNTGAKQDSGAATDADSQNQETQPTPPTPQKMDVTKTVEFKSALTKAIEQKIPQLKRQIAKDLTGEGEGLPTVDELQRRLSLSEEKARLFETKESIREYLQDAKNKAMTRPENSRAIEKLVLAEIITDEDGEITNMREAIETVRREAPTLFLTNSMQINGASGKQSPNVIDFNDQIRAAAGFRAN